MAQKILKTSIRIEASAETVWQILSDFEAYPEWNPFITAFEGEVYQGAKIKITAGGMGFKPIVLKYDENIELRWIGKLLFTGVFDGEHSFVIKDNNDGSITFLQEEIFNGILVGLFSKQLDTDTKAGFIAMNEKLKEMAETNQKNLERR